jgi:putative endonuclease
MNKQGFIYILGNERPTLYIGVTSDLQKRLWEHKNKFVDGFTKKYNLNKLLYYEVLDDIEQAIIREKQLKNMLRKQKIALISKINPLFNDLSGEIEY